MSEAFGDSPRFIGFGAFETTAFLTSILVAFYDVIPNPEGQQGVNDQSEYDVYCSWRRAMLIFCIQIALMISVLVSVLTRDTSATASWWLLALMVAPWAPEAKKVVGMLSNIRAVMEMMRTRYTRNEIVTIVRERFKFGQRGIETSLVMSYAFGESAVPTIPVQTLRDNERLNGREEEIRKSAEDIAGIKNPRSLDLGALWIVSQSTQPNSMSWWRLQLRFFLAKVDPLTRLWTVRAIPLDEYDPFPKYRDVQLDLMTRSRVLDFIDSLQLGGTISSSLVQRAVKPQFCLHCRVAIRGAVEAFMESSMRSHTDLRAKVWLKDINADWRGNFERVIDVFWEASFIEVTSIRVEPDEEDKSRSFGDRTKVSTLKFMALLFTITRSLLGSFDKTTPLEEISQVVKDGLHCKAWWERYWGKVESRMPEWNADVENGVSESRSLITAAMKGSLRDMIDEDMKKIVNLLLDDRSKRIDGVLCTNAGCILTEDTQILFHQV